MIKLSPNNINYAINRFTSFVKVQSKNSREERRDAIDLWAEAAGVDTESWDVLTTRLDKIVSNEAGELGWAIIGFMMGCYAMEDYADSLLDDYEDRHKE